MLMPARITSWVIWALLAFFELAGFSLIAMAIRFHPPTPLNARHVITALALISGVPVVYLLPSIVASARRHPNVERIALVNIFLGWTLAGWIWALAQTIGGTSRD